MPLGILYSASWLFIQCHLAFYSVPLGILYSSSYLYTVPLGILYNATWYLIQCHLAFDTVPLGIFYSASWATWHFLQCQLAFYTRRCTQHLSLQRFCCAGLYDNPSTRKCDHQRRNTYCTVGSNPSFRNPRREVASVRFGAVWNGFLRGIVKGGENKKHHRRIN